MAWMPVAEAAARLGVSERTIWRRIKSATIPSRSEAGRTLVDFDESNAVAEGPRSFLQRGADLAARGLDDEALTALVNELGAFRAASEREVLRARRSKRAALAVAALLAAVLGTGVWYHVAALLQLEAAHAADRNTLDLVYEQDLGTARAALARAETLTAAQADELVRLRRSHDEQRAAVAGLESSREALQCLVDERLNELATALAASSRGDGDWMTEKAQLARTIDELRAAVHQKELAVFATQQQSDRIIAALRRHAARNAGLAEGLQIHIGFQQEALARAQAELSELHTLLAEAPEAQRTLRDLAARQELLAAMNRTLEASSATAPAAGPRALWTKAVARVQGWCISLRDRARAQAADDTLARVD